MSHPARAGLVWLLQGLFALRVLGQIYVGLYQPSWLPGWDEWYSGLMPYPWLLPTQLVMLMAMTALSYDYARGSGRLLIESVRVRRVVRVFSYLYAGAMALRYVLTMWLAPEMRWLHGTIPIVFHLVLAAYLYLLTVAPTPRHA